MVKQNYDGIPKNVYAVHWKTLSVESALSLDHQAMTEPQLESLVAATVTKESFPVFDKQRLGCSL